MKAENKEKENVTCLEPYEEIIDLIPYGVAIIDMKRNIVASNHGLSTLLSYTTEELVGMTIDKVLDVTTLSILKEQLNNNEHPQGPVTRAGLLDRHGKSIPVELSVRRMPQSGLLLCTIRDIRHEVKLEDSIASSESKYRSLFDASPVPHLTLSRRGVILDVNDAASLLLGYSKEDLLRHDISSFFVREGKNDIAEQVLNAILDGSVLRDVEVRLRRSDNEPVWVAMTSNPVSENGKIVSINIMAIDINRRKIAEAKAQAERERANLYLDIMTHDLNNANQSIMFELDILQDTYDLPEAARHLIQEASWNVRRAARMIDNLRTIMYIQESPPQRVPVDPYESLVSAISAVRQDMPWKKLVIRSDLHDGQFKVVGHQYLTNVFFNVIHNCAQYSTDDEVHININTSLLDDQSTLQITVEDYGRGIPDSMKETIFKRTESTSAQNVGRGLGLTLSDLIVKGLEGQMWVEDRVRGDYTKGTRVVIRLPIWRQTFQPECGRSSCIEFYRSDHCLFCEPVMEMLLNSMRELSVPTYLLRVINVDDPTSGIDCSQIRELPMLRVCEHTLTGMVAQDQIQTALMGIILRPCYSGA